MSIGITNGQGSLAVSFKYVLCQINCSQLFTNFWNGLKL